MARTAGTQIIFIIERMATPSFFQWVTAKEMVMKRFAEGKNIIAGLFFALVVNGATFAGESVNNPPQTFIDTLNKGKELPVTNVAPSPMVQQVAPVVTPTPAPTPAKTPAETTAVAIKTEPKPEAGVVPSRFKIQVLASSQQDQVKKEKALLSGKTSLPLVISFETPYYKLYAGDFSQRSEADNSLAQIKSFGYKDAWIVRTAAQKK
jgi:hypothetical protein